MRERRQRLLEAVYEDGADDARWLRRIVEHASPLLDTGAGVHAFHVDLDATAPIYGPLLVGGQVEWQKSWEQHWWRDTMLGMPHEALRTMAAFGAVNTTNHLWAATAARIETFAELLRRLDDAGYRHALATLQAPTAATRLFYPESVNVVGLDTSGRGVVLVANRTSQVAARIPRRRLLAELAAHLAAASRLRRRRPRGVSTTVDAEGVLSPEGRVLHAEGPAREARALEALRRAAARHERAAKAATDAEALALWGALQAGRWTVVERRESDGRRLLIARENRATPVATRSALTLRERQVLGELACGLSNKEIGYRLGLAASTVSSHLHTAAAKLGIAARAPLLTHARALLGETTRGGT